jgi:hypothetical protein
LSLEEKANAAVDPAAKARLASLGVLEQKVLAQLPRNSKVTKSFSAAFMRTP